MSASLENPPTRLESPQPSLDTNIDSVAWKRVSPRYLKLRLVQRSIWTILCVALSAIPLLGHYIFHWNVPLWLGWGLVALMLLWQGGLFVLVPRQVRSWGYSEYPEHLLLTKGVLTRSTTAVPYGRMQLVDVSSGPLENMLGLATVDLKTASAATNAVIHGLERDEAHRLRQVLTLRGEERMVAM